MISYLSLVSCKRHGQNNPSTVSLSTDLGNLGMVKDGQGLYSAYLVDPKLTYSLQFTKQSIVNGGNVVNYEGDTLFCDTNITQDNPLPFCQWTQYPVRSGIMRFVQQGNGFIMSSNDGYGSSCVSKQENKVHNPFLDGFKSMYSAYSVTYGTDTSACILFTEK